MQSIIINFIMIYVLIGVVFSGLIYILYRRKNNRDIVDDIRTAATEKTENVNSWSQFAVALFIYVFYVLLWPKVIINAFKK